MSQRHTDLEKAYNELYEIFVKYHFNPNEAFYLLSLLQNALLREEMEGIVKDLFYKYMR